MKPNNRSPRGLVSACLLLAAWGGALAMAGSHGLSAAQAQTSSSMPDKRPVITQDSLRFGAYDPHGDFTDDKNSTIEHLFLPWEDVDLSSLGIADAYARERNRSLLITVEPWSWALDWRVSPEDLYAGIMNGRYDANMTEICSVASSLKSDVTIRWAQEMDEDEGQFTWAFWSPPQYVAAYRRMVEVCRKQLPDAKYMWSPKGVEGLEQFYPGDSFVDVIGLSVFALQQYDRDKFGRDRGFAETVEPGYQRVVGFGKPIVVAELGYKGDEAYVRNWAETAAKPDPKFPELTAVVYFNDREVYPWPENYGRPDWRVRRDIVN